MSPAFILMKPYDAGALARIHGLCFERPWSAAEFREFLQKPGMLALGIEGADALAAFILVQNAGDTAEILTLATDPVFRRQGFAAELVRGVLTRLGERGVRRLNLDVAADNIGALALYRKFGFTEDSIRKGYYQRGDSPHVDAVLMSRPVAGQLP